MPLLTCLEHTFCTFPPPNVSAPGGANSQATSHRVQLANAKAVAPWNRGGLDFSPRPNSPIGVVRIQSPVYKESPRLLLKHPSHPQLNMTSNSGGLSAGHQVNSTSSNSAHVPPGQGSRFGVGSTSLAPRTTSPPPGLAGSPHAKAVPQTRQSHVIPNALATSMAAAATAATTSQGVVGGVFPENSALDPTQPAMGLKSVIQTAPAPLGGPPMLQQQQGIPAVPSQQMQLNPQVQFQVQSLQHQQLAHLVPPQDQTQFDENVIRKPSSDITQVPSRRVGGSQMAAQFELQGVDVECCNICDIFCDV